MNAIHIKETSNDMTSKGREYDVCRIQEKSKTKPPHDFPQSFKKIQRKVQARMKRTQRPQKREKTGRYTDK